MSILVTPGPPSAGIPVGALDLARFHKVARVGEVPPGTGRVVQVNGLPVALFNVGGRFHALDNTCPHQGGPLGEGILDGGVVTCPWHFWQFDVAKGHAPDFPDMKVARYEVRVQADEILVAETPLNGT